jgi:hypothetical protein
MKPIPKVKIIASVIIQPLAWIRAVAPGPLGIKRLPPCPGGKGQNEDHQQGVFNGCQWISASMK